MITNRLRLQLFLIVVNLILIGAQIYMSYRNVRFLHWAVGKAAEAQQTLVRAQQTYQHALDVCQHPCAGTEHKVSLAKENQREYR